MGDVVIEGTTAGVLARGGGIALLPPGPSVRIRGTRYAVRPPKLKDPRMTVAAVTISLHVLGQLGLHFQVSVPQILSAILTCFVLGGIIEFRKERAFVWPASAMLTGSGIALILRVPDTPLHDHWTFHKWYVFAGVGVLAIVVKQLVQYRGNPLFNPSNVALVATFVVLGSSRVAPLDFWWAPMNGWLIAAYAIILVGGTSVTGRLGVLVMAATFWATFAAGMALLATTGHCMVANWAFAPVCGGDQWRNVVFSPELLVFTYFMVTDPKTVPRGRVGRPLFAMCVAVTCVLLIATQTTEFGAKVGLLGGLTLLCAARPLFDRLVPAPGSPDDHVWRFARRLVSPRASGRTPARHALVAVSAVLVVAAAVTGVLVAGRSATGAFAEDSSGILDRVPRTVNPDTLPQITIDRGVLDWNHAIAGKGAEEVVLSLAENLEVENAALRRGDRSMLAAVDHGDRLDSMAARITGVESGAATVLRHYDISDVNIVLIVPFGRQDGLSLGLRSTGTLTEETLDQQGNVVSSTERPFATTFVLRRATGARWLNVAELPYDQPA